MSVSPEEFDLDGAMNDISTAMLGDDPDVPRETSEEVNELDTPTEKPAEPAPEVRPPPKSWAKDMHEEWAKLTPKAQEYYEQREKQMLDGLEQYKGDAGYAKQLKEIVTPYKPMLDAMGVSETDAIKYLLNAQYRFTNGSDEQRRQAYAQLGAELGFAEPQDLPAIDPVVKDLQEKLSRVESVLTTREQQERQATKQRVDSEIEAFAADTKNQYFNDVSRDMVPFINAGLTLKDAYDRAIWANPLTRTKEQARLQTEAETAFRENAKKEAEEARKAKSVNVRGQESHREPTEPKGKMFDDMGDMLKSIKSRVN